MRPGQVEFHDRPDHGNEGVVLRTATSSDNKGDVKGGNLFTPGSTTKGGRHRAENGPSFGQELKDAAIKTIKGLTGLGGVGQSEGSKAGTSAGESGSGSSGSSSSSSGSGSK